MIEKSNAVLEDIKKLYNIDLLHAFCQCDLSVIYLFDYSEDAKNVPSIDLHYFPYALIRKNTPQIFNKVLVDHPHIEDISIIFDNEVSYNIHDRKIKLHITLDETFYTCIKYLVNFNKGKHIPEDFSKIVEFVKADINYENVYRYMYEHLSKIKTLCFQIDNYLCYFFNKFADPNYWYALSKNLKKENLDLIGVKL